PGSNTGTLIVTGPVGMSTNSQTNAVVGINPPHLAVSPLNHNFGSVTTGQTNTLNFSVSNSGDVTLTGTATTVLPFGVSSNATFSVGPGLTGTVSVSFMPTSAISSAADVVFNSNGGISTT